MYSWLPLEVIVAYDMTCQLRSLINRGNTYWIGGREICLKTWLSTSLRSAIYANPERFLAICSASNEDELMPQASWNLTSMKHVAAREIRRCSDSIAKLLESASSHTSRNKRCCKWNTDGRITPRRRGINLSLRVVGTRGENGRNIAKIALWVGWCIRAIIKRIRRRIGSVSVLRWWCIWSWWNES